VGLKIEIHEIHEIHKNLRNPVSAMIAYLSATSAANIIKAGDVHGLLTRLKSPQA